MPKEKIYDSSELFDIEIGWGFGTDVQLGISTHDGRSLADWLAGNGLPPASESALPGREPEINDRHGYSRAVTTDVQELPQFSSLWASLDRPGINRLIKMLRKARDEAYGRDE